MSGGGSVRSESSGAATNLSSVRPFEGIKSWHAMWHRACNPSRCGRRNRCWRHRTACRAAPAAAAPSLAPRPARPLLEVKNPAGDYPVWSSSYRALKTKKNAVRHQAREEGGGAWAAPAAQAAVSAMLRSWSAAPAPGGAGGGMACCRRPWALQGGPDPAPPQSCRPAV